MIVHYTYLKSCRRLPGNSLIGISPSCRTGAAYLRKSHYQKTASSHKVPVTLPVIGYFPLVSLLQYPNWQSFVSNVRQLYATTSQSVRHRQSWRIRCIAPLFSASCRINMKLSRCVHVKYFSGQKGNTMPTYTI